MTVWDFACQHELAFLLTCVSVFGGGFLLVFDICTIATPNSGSRWATPMLLELPDGGRVVGKAMLGECPTCGR